MEAKAFSARFENVDRGRVVVEGLVTSESEVVEEARHWTSGARGTRCEDVALLEGADMTAFVREALTLGAKMLTVAAQTTDARALERMLKDVGDKTTQATQTASAATVAATKSATETVSKAAADATKAITQADEITRKHMAEAVATAKDAMVAETRRMFGGESPELLERLQPLLDKFSVALEKQVQEGTTAVMEKAAKQLDPSDPTSPMARHTAALAEQQDRLVKQIEKGHADLAVKVDELSAALTVRQAKSELASVTTLKGFSFEDDLHGVLEGIAAGLGDEYEDTTKKTGLIARSKKGDGLLTTAIERARVVIEMTDSSRDSWGAYFDEAERNRGATASLGIVKTPDQNGGHTIRVIGQRRVVIAFDPATDDESLLRTVIQLLRTVAIAAAVRSGAAEIDTAEEKISEALQQLAKVDSIKKTAGSIQKSAQKIDSECTSIESAITRLLNEALAALTVTSPTLAGGESAIQGVA